MKCRMLIGCHFAKAHQKGDLFFQVVVRTVEPIPAIRAAMNSEWTADRIPELLWHQFVVLRKDFDAFAQGATLNRTPNRVAKS